MSKISKNQFDSVPTWVSDRNRGDDDESLVNSHDHYVNDWVRSLDSSAENNAQKLAYASEVFLSFKQANVLDSSERADLPKKDFAQPKKEDETTGTKGKYPIPDEQHARSALGFAKMHHDPSALAAVRKKVEKKFPDMLEKEADFEDEHGTGGPPLKDRSGVRRAVLPSNPLVADDSINAVSHSESSAVKEAGVAGKVLRGAGKIFSRPDVGSAASWGLIGGAASAAGAPKGKRLSTGLKSGIAGGLLGAYVPRIEQGARTWGRKAKFNNWINQASNVGPTLTAGGVKVATVDFNPVERAAEKYPEKVTATEALKEDVGGVWNLLRKKMQNFKQKRVELTAGPEEEKTAGLKEMARAAFPVSEAGIGAGIGLGGLMAGATYLGSRPREDLGGKSKSEVTWEKAVDSQGPDEGAGLTKRLRNRSTEFTKDVSSEFRKNPGTASLIAGLVGLSLGMRAARLAGAGR